MKPKVYLETTIVSFLTARPSRDAAMAGLIEHTKTWWNERRLSYDLAISDVVIREASGGDGNAARRRREMLRVACDSGNSARQRTGPQFHLTPGRPSEGR